MGLNGHGPNEADMSQAEIDAFVAQWMPVPHDEMPVVPMSFVVNARPHPTGNVQLSISTNLGTQFFYMPPDFAAAVAAEIEKAIRLISRGKIVIAGLDQIPPHPGAN